MGEIRWYTHGTWPEPVELGEYISPRCVVTRSDRYGEQPMLTKRLYRTEREALEEYSMFLSQTRKTVLESAEATMKRTPRKILAFIDHAIEEVEKEIRRKQ